MITLEKKYLKYLSFETLYKDVFSKREFNKYELGGEYDLSQGFKINPQVSKYNEEEERPYTLLNNQSKTKILWHSHPFRDPSPNNFPSIEDIDAVRLLPSTVHLLLVDKGIYILSALEKYTSIDNVVQLYLYMQSQCTGEWDYNSIEKNFLKNKISNVGDMRKYGIYVHFIPLEKMNTQMLNKKIKDAFGYKK